MNDTMKLNVNGLRCLPAEGGGFAVNEIAQTTERYLNLTITVEEEHSLAFELRAYGANDEKTRVTVRFA